MRFVFFLQAFKNADRIGYRWLINLHLLETTLKRGVLFDVLAVLVERGSTDALQLGAAECRLDYVGCVHRPLGRPRTHDRVKLVNEKNDILHLADLIHHRLDPLLELTTVFRTGNHQREVECHDFFVAQNFRHIARGYFLSKAFDDRRLADARFTDQHRVVLGAAAENLDDALDFALTSDHWIEPAFFGDLGEVTTKGLERRGLGLSLAFGAGSLDLTFILEGPFSTLDVIVVIIVIVILR